MKRLSWLFLLSVLLLTVRTYADNNGEVLQNKIKVYFNDMNAKVKSANNPQEKREIMNKSFSKITDALAKMESLSGFSKNDKTFINSFKNDISEKYAELNGLKGNEKVADKDLNNFADYTQQSMEVADKYVTISITTLLLVAILLILLLR